MITEMKELSMAEASEYLESEELQGFAKKFVKVKPAEAKKMRTELEAVDSIKIKSEHIAKIIDILPEDAVDLGKIFSEISLDENEANKILEIVKSHK